MTKARFFEPLENGAALCTLCPHRCAIAPGKFGICGVRRCDGGSLIAESYGAVTAAALDPIEKKPLRRFHPGSKILSIGSYGCNFKCGFCQNSSISMEKPPFSVLSPDDVARASLELEKSGSIGVAYTYNEPLTGYEFVLDCARLIKKQGQKNVLVTNGYIRQEPLMALLPFADAMNIDLKAFTSSFYKEIGGELEAVKSTIETAAQGCHIEVTALIIPGKNDSDGEMLALSRWLAGISDEIPLHVSRFFPSYKWRDIPPTPVDTVFRLSGIARQSLKYVFEGNC